MSKFLCSVFGCSFKLDSITGSGGVFDTFYHLTCKRCNKKVVQTWHQFNYNDDPVGYQDIR